MGSPLNISFEIAKVDTQKREVWGFATVEQLDHQGEIVDFDASVEAFKSWPGNIREQHDKTRAIGTCVGWQPVPERRAIWVGARLSRSADGENAWLKCKENVLRGFSIGGERLATRQEVSKATGRAVTRVTKYKLTELSLVDNPACPDAGIHLIKVVDGVSVPTEAIEKMNNNMQHGSLRDDIDLWTGERTADSHPAEIVTGGGAAGARYRLVAKSAGGLALYVDDAHRARRAFIVRSPTGARLGSTDMAAIRKAAGPAGWMLLPGEHVIGAGFISGALTTQADGTSPPSNRAQYDPRNTEPGYLQTTDTDGVRRPGPSAPSPDVVADWAGWPKKRPGLHSNDDVLRRDLNQ